MQKPPVAKKTPVRPTRAGSTQTSKRVLPRARTVVAESASPDTMLLLGGLALFVLVLGDTVFLTLSARFLRQT